MIGIIGAIPEEVNAIIASMQVLKTKILGKRKYYIGTLENQDCVVVFSRIGKVAAAITTTTLIHEFHVDKIFFTGGAGGIGKKVKVGDIVLATQLAQHDFDAFPLYPKNEIPLLNKNFFKPDSVLNDIAQVEINSFLNSEALLDYVPTDILNDFAIVSPKLHLGLIASGDQFIHKKEQVLQLIENFPETLCVEMEGAAVAQVCHEYQIPFVVIRTISDHANDTAHHDFNLFIEHISSKYGLWIIKHILQNIKKAGQ